MYGIFLEYNFHQVLRFSSCLLTFTLLAAVVLFNVRVSITGGKLIRDAHVWKRNSVEGNTPLQELFTVLFYEGYFLLQWKWWIRFFLRKLANFHCSEVCSGGHTSRQVKAVGWETKKSFAGGLTLKWWLQDVKVWLSSSCDEHKNYIHSSSFASCGQASEFNHWYLASGLSANLSKLLLWLLP